jgi:hypothetical protein
MILSVPLRFYPWIIAEMTDPRRAPRYLYDDFIGPTWHLGQHFGMTISTLLSRVTVGLLKGLGAISVERNCGPCVEAFWRSLALLMEGNSLLIFPEDPAAPADPETQLHSFLCGFVALCYMYEDATGKRLPIYPAAVHPGSKTVAVGKAIFFDKDSNRREGVRRTCGRLRGDVQELYCALSTHDTLHNRSHLLTEKPNTFIIQGKQTCRSSNDLVVRGTR